MATRRAWSWSQSLSTSELTSPSLGSIPSHALTASHRHALATHERNERETISRLDYPSTSDAALSFVSQKGRVSSLCRFKADICGSIFSVNQGGDDPSTWSLSHGCSFTGAGGTQHTGSAVHTAPRQITRQRERRDGRG